MNLVIEVMRKSGLLVALVGALHVTGASAQAAADGRFSWDAFKCAIYAEHAEDAEARGTYFNLGYQAAFGFISGISNGTISEEDVREDAPVGVTSALSGPNADFMIGRIFAAASDAAVGQLIDRSPDLYAFDEAAETLLTEMDCQSLIRK